MKEVYFTTFPGKYFTGDGARKDEDGYYWLMGRVDDVINVSGHRMGTAEVESALVSHPSVAEAAVVGFPHDIKGEGIYAYVILKSGQEASDDLAKILDGSRPRGDRADREAGPHPLRARAAQDPLRQDHAPHPAQGRRGRARDRARSATSRRCSIRRSSRRSSTRRPRSSQRSTDRHRTTAPHPSSGCGAVVRRLCTRRAQRPGESERTPANMAYNDLFLRACRREPTERTPVWMMRQAGRYLPEYRAIRAKHGFLEMCKTPELACEVTLQPVDLVGVDAAILFADILLPLEGMGLELDVREGRGPAASTTRSARKADVEKLRVSDPYEDTGLRDGRDQARAAASSRTRCRSSASPARRSRSRAT